MLTRGHRGRSCAPPFHRFPELVDRHVFQRVGMTRSARIYRDLPLRADLADAIARPYAINADGTAERAKGPAAQGDGAAGGIVSTVRDLAKFDIALDAGELLTPASYAAMMEPAKNSTGARLAKPRLVRAAARRPRTALAFGMVGRRLVRVVPQGTRRAPHADRAGQQRRRLVGQSTRVGRGTEVGFRASVLRCVPAALSNPSGGWPVVLQESQTCFGLDAIAQEYFLVAPLRQRSGPSDRRVTLLA